MICLCQAVYGPPDGVPEVGAVLIPLLTSAPRPAHNAFYLRLILCPESESTGQAHIPFGVALEVSPASVHFGEVEAVLGALCQPHHFGVRHRRSCPRALLRRLVWALFAGFAMTVGFWDRRKDAIQVADWIVAPPVECQGLNYGTFLVLVV